MRHFLIFVFFVTHSVLFGQLTDDFSDGDFIANPAWSGVTADYIVNPTFELQLNNTVAGASYLSTPHGLANLDNKEWKVWTRQSFSPSGSNFGRIYLTSSSADLTSDPDGFYLQLGEAGANDAVRLFKAVGGVHTELLAGPLAQIATSFTIGLRVVRDNAANWSLEIDPAGGTNYSLAGTVNDATALLGSHFGFYDEYTASNASKFYYDDVYVGDEILDLTPPTLLSATAINATQVDLLFDEPLAQTAAETVANYSFALGLIINSAVQDGVDPALVHINMSTPFTNGSTYTITANNIEDMATNVAGAQDMMFSYLVAEVPLPGDVIINEFLCDETPTVGLPLAEYVEIFNTSSKVFDLDGWKIGDASSDGTIQQAWLYPGSYMVLASTSDVDSFTVVAGVTSFPSLNNSGDALVLRSDVGLVLDSINYTTDWYADPSKEGGGYSIERRNPLHPCSDITNWAASVDNLGGTPGTQNSIYDITPDTNTPWITELIALAPNYVEVYYNKGMDSTSLADAVITTFPGLTVQNHYVLETHPKMTTIQFVENLNTSQLYEIEIQNVADCWTNATTLEGEFALPDIGVKGDLVINEIMFNPFTGGSDWIEIYNNSEKLINLNGWEVAKYINDTIGTNEVVDDNYLLYPDEYVVLTEDSAHILQNYAATIPGRFIQMDLPSFNNDSSTVYLILGAEVMDKVSYDSDWHFKLLDDDDGKSLERMDPAGPSNEQSNWHTAAEAIGFATPGGMNSQYYPAISNGDFSYTSETISPDNDGFEDVLQVNYELNEPGLLGTFSIYDDRGRFVATVMKQELLAASGMFTWQGIREDGAKATIGTYVGIFEAYGINGGLIFTKKKAFTVAGRL